jgi:hypothetical protein
MAYAGRWCVRGSAVGGVGRGARCKLVGASSTGSWPSTDRRAVMAGHGEKQRGRGERRKKGMLARVLLGREKGGRRRSRLELPFSFFCFLLQNVNSNSFYLFQ